MYSRGQISRMFGIKETTLRFYEREGLVVPAIAEGNSNKRRAYSEDDIERLHRLVILREYGLDLDTCKQVLDEEVNLEDALEIQLDELLREVNRIRNLILFTKFLQATDSDLIYGLEFGPADIDAFADYVRETELYRAAMSRISSYNEDELQLMFAQLDDIIHDFVTADPDLGFAAIEKIIDRFCEWWDANVVPMSEAGYLGFWAIFEDDSVIVSEVEQVGGETASSSLQMHAFYVWMKRLLNESSALMSSIAANAKSDVVLAMEQIGELTSLINSKMGVDSNYTEFIQYFLDCMISMLGDEELAEYLNIEDSSAETVEDIEAVKEVVSLMIENESSEGEERSHFNTESVSDAGEIIDADAHFAGFDPPDV